MSRVLPFEFRREKINKSDIIFHSILLFGLDSIYRQCQELAPQGQVVKSHFIFLKPSGIFFFLLLLLPDEIVVDSLLPLERFVISYLRHSSAGDDGDDIRVLHCAQPMGNHKHGAAFGSGLQGILIEKAGLVERVN